MNEFTPEQEKRINELIEQREKRAGLLGWLCALLPSSALFLFFLPIHFNEVDEAFHSWQDTIEDAPVVMSYVGEMASNAVDLARHGQLPKPRDPNLLVFFSSGTNSYTPPVSHSLFTRGSIGITAGTSIIVIDGDGVIKADTKKPLA